MEKQICNKCNQEKDMTEFEIRNDTKKHRKQCRECRRSKQKKYWDENKEDISERRKPYMKEYNVEYREKNRDKLNEASRKYNEKNRERLNEYKKEYKKINKDAIYEKRKNYFQEYQKNNREAYYKYQKQWRKDNPDKVKEYKQIYIEKNPDSVENIKQWQKKYNKQYQKNNRDSIRQNKRSYEKERRKVDINYKLKCNLRTRIYSVLKGIRKSDTTRNLVGCTIDQLKKHLEGRFTSEMTWENYGSYWEVDHIISCANFDLTKIEQQKKCFHYSNLQPLEAKENASKREHVRLSDIIS